jgi:CDP-diacylglycerol--glycerol-3-phosphate 3-phosphatidyltransferase
VPESRRNAPNLLSGFRIACVPLLLALAWSGATGAFLVLFAVALATDVLDGIVARRLGQTTEFGARLDQWGDFALWLSLPLAVWWLWPDVVRREAVYAAIAVVCMVTPTAIAWGKYRAVPSYHTWSVKAGAIAMGVTAPLLLLFDVALPFRAAALFQIVCAIDELGITLLSPTCRHDVPSLLHVLRERKAAR